MPYKDKEKQKNYHDLYWRVYYSENRASILSSHNRRNQIRLDEDKCYRCGAPLIADEDKYCFACLAGRMIPQVKGVLKYETAD